MLRDTNNLTNKQINGLIATKIMGCIPTSGNWWMPDGKWNKWNCSIEEADAWTFEVNDRGVEYNGKKYNSHSVVRWEPHKDLNICFEVEKQIALIGMEKHYIAYLKQEIALDNISSDNYEFLCLHASAKQRALAMVDLINNHM